MRCRNGRPDHAWTNGRRSIERVRTWTVAHADLERERVREFAKIGNNLNLSLANC